MNPLIIIIGGLTGMVTAAAVTRLGYGLDSPVWWGVMFIAWIGIGILAVALGSLLSRE